MGYRGIKLLRMEWEGAGTIYGGGEKHTGFRLGNVRVRGALRRFKGKISKLMFRTLDGTMGWIDLVADRDIWL
jgi:hypothetical protein